MTMRSRSLSAVAAVVMAAQILSAQTTITPPKNKYSPQDDVKLGRAQATKATPSAIGQMAGAILGSILGGRTGSVVSQGAQIGFGTAFLRFSREYEKQADLLGAQMMARAGYDPRDMANMFKTIEAQGKSGGPQWMSDHPNPGNRQGDI